MKASAASRTYGLISAQGCPFARPAAWPILARCCRPEDIRSRTGAGTVMHVGACQ
jgi:hypothetical protein